MKGLAFKSISKMGRHACMAMALFAYGLNTLAGEPASNPYRGQAFPQELKRYETEIFRLVDTHSSTDPATKISYYDAKAATQFDAVLKNFSYLDKRLKRKLLSGPAPKGKYIAINGAHHIFYTICQAHWCNVTNISILYDPEKQRMAGRLLHACTPYEFGDVTKEEMRVIDAMNPIQVDEETCKLAREK